MKNNNYQSPNVEVIELVMENGILQMSGEGSNLDYESVFNPTF